MGAPAHRRPALIRVLVADDQQLVRDGIAAILRAQPDLELAGQATNGHDAVRLARGLRPDVALRDIRMPFLDGIQATAEIVATCPRTSVLILTTFDVDEYVFAALRAGAVGFLFKDATREELTGAIRGVANGDMILAPEVTRRLVDRLVVRRGRDTAARTGLAELTDREKRVLELVARGLTNGEIALQLGIGEATVKTHAGHLLMKLELRDRVQAVIFAYESGLV